MQHHTPECFERHPDFTPEIPCTLLSKLVTYVNQEAAHLRVDFSDGVPFDTDAPCGKTLHQWLHLWGRDRLTFVETLAPVIYKQQPFFVYLFGVCVLYVFYSINGIINVHFGWCGRTYARTLLRVCVCFLVNLFGIILCL
eukprot:GDKI01043268.1.p1 GENE.GDKI01043268.1~~GDKI01043268.1.p1  ORF type:complete len:140 (+),score=15.41 GDKI01043268.1:474-893(+)